MNEPQRWHRHFGAYGICYDEGKLLVIRKNGGPYTGRYDLPGGTVEPLETLADTVRREFLEETGILVGIERSLGVRDYVVAWEREGFAHTHCHHIAALYEVVRVDGDIANSPNIDDSDGAEWIRIDELPEEEASPLVRDAVRWIRTGQVEVAAARFDHWQTRGKG